MVMTVPEPRYNRQHHVTATPLPERSRHQIPPPQRRHRKHRDNRSRHKLIAALISFVVGCFISTAWFRGEGSANSLDVTTASRRSEQNGTSVRSASVEQVVNYLMKLAQRNPADLWTAFGMDGSSNHDPFSLSSLESGTCPFPSSKVEWLPPRPAHSSELSAAFAKSVSENSKEIPRKQKRRNKSVAAASNNDVMLWYEHISKAGGTTFCGLANSNMPKLTVPRYHCMPRKGDLMDGRVGSWSNDELIQFINQNKYRIVANEWDPFDLSKLELSGRGGWKAEGPSNLQSPSLLFVTTLRDPGDRLLSSYTFFSDYSEKQLKDPANWGTWMRRNLGRTGNFRIGQKSGFRANIARNNYMVWRFSGGNLPATATDESLFSSTSNVFPSTVTDQLVWKQPFETAIRVLSQHDLILPMDVMTAEAGKKALEDVLGWTQFSASGRGIVGEKESGHVVTTGEVRNSNARSYLEENGSGDEFKALWERNWLDYVIWYWARAVFFTRLYCNVQ